MAFLNKSFKLFINGKLIAENGDLNIYRTSMDKRYRPDIFIIPWNRELEIVLQISGFDDLCGRFESPLYFGRYSELKIRQSKKEFLDIALFAILLIIGIYHLFFLYGFTQE